MQTVLLSLRSVEERIASIEWGQSNLQDTYLHQLQAFNSAQNQEMRQGHAELLADTERRIALLNQEMAGFLLWRRYYEDQLNSLRNCTEFDPFYPR
jgi:hypothetical protein